MLDLAIEHVGFTVGNMERSLRFYRDLLGMKVFNDRVEDRVDYAETITGVPGARFRIVHLELHGSHLELLEYLSPEGQRVPPRPCDVGSGHLCFLVKDIWAVYKRLSDAGVRFASEPVPKQAGPYPKGWGVYLFDPDGIPLEMTEKYAPENQRQVNEGKT